MIFVFVCSSRQVTCPHEGGEAKSSSKFL